MKKTSPMTREYVSVDSLSYNRSLKQAIETFFTVLELQSQALQGADHVSARPVTEAEFDKLVQGDAEGVPAPWQEDWGVKSCSICLSNFSFFFRKHHCRACGKVYCSRCCSTYLRYPRIYEPKRKLLRTCKDCVQSFRDKSREGLLIVASNHGLFSHDTFKLLDLVFCPWSCEPNTLYFWKDIITEHRDACPCATWFCPEGCGSLVTQHNKEEHESSCSFKKVECEWNCEGVRRFEKDDHKNVCPNYLVACTQEDCKQKVRRKDLQDHLLVCEWVEVECPHKGCSEIFPRRESGMHSTSCKMKQMVCNLGCSASFRKQDLEQHLEFCTEVVIECPDCHIAVKRKDMQSHFNKSCGWKMVQCESCGASLMRNFLSSHEDACKYKVITCEFGCGEQKKRMDMEAHEAECGHFLVVCPDGCNRKIMRKDLAEHRANKCKDLFVKCPNGCKGLLSRKNLPSHMQNCPHQLVRCRMCGESLKRANLQEHTKICGKETKGDKPTEEAEKSEYTEAAPKSTASPENIPKSTIASETEENEKTPETPSSNVTFHKPAVNITSQPMLTRSASYPAVMPSFAKIPPSNYNIPSDAPPPYSYYVSKRTQPSSPTSQNVSPSRDQIQSTPQSAEQSPIQNNNQFQNTTSPNNSPTRESKPQNMSPLEDNQHQNNSSSRNSSQYQNTSTRDSGRPQNTPPHSPSHGTGQLTDSSSSGTTTSPLQHTPPQNIAPSHGTYPQHLFSPPPTAAYLQQYPPGQSFPPQNVPQHQGYSAPSDYRHSYPFPYNYPTQIPSYYLSPPLNYSPARQPSVQTSHINQAHPPLNRSFSTSQIVKQPVSPVPTTPPAQYSPTRPQQPPQQHQQQPQPVIRRTRSVTLPQGVTPQMWQGLPPLHVLQGPGAPTRYAPSNPAHLINNKPPPGSVIFVPSTASMQSPPPPPY
eukprot:CAMPEP_0174253742 /NCGR_PEP_ID=MMETSP0439-20130205/3094_1 /TAXON_ID=0 /ORGANISM="Stereomyxa ramosa, Strain Chinc5" /LENGTH=924 /DNA_ID=CAMNT_0015334925 /DNA_START=308 /DNA_END=3082 /DNA_ORIENTATION=-